MKLVEMYKFSMKQYSKYNLIIKQSKNRIMLDNSTWHCCSYLWTRKIKQNADFKAVKRSDQ